MTAKSIADDMDVEIGGGSAVKSPHNHIQTRSFSQTRYRRRCFSDCLEEYHETD